MSGGGGGGGGGGIIHQRRGASGGAGGANATSSGAVSSASTAVPVSYHHGSASGQQGRTLEVVDDDHSGSSALLCRSLVVFACSALILLSTSLFYDPQFDRIADGRGHGSDRAKRMTLERFSAGDAAFEEGGDAAATSWPTRPVPSRDGTASFPLGDDAGRPGAEFEADAVGEGGPGGGDDVAADDSDVAGSDTDTSDRVEIPRNLVFVTDRLPGDAKIDPRTLENAGIWQDLYKGPGGYKMHFFPSITSIEKFLETNAPEYLVPFQKCETEMERFDLARLVILHTLGGISVDIAVARPLERLDALLDDLNPNGDREQLVVALDYDFDSSHDARLWSYPRRRGVATHCFAVTPRHPVLGAILERVSHNLLHRDEVDDAILRRGEYPPDVLQDPRKAALLRRTWTTGSGPFSDGVFEAVDEQRERLRRAKKETGEEEVDPRGAEEAGAAEGVEVGNGGGDDTPTLSSLATDFAPSPPSGEVIVLPRETFMSTHPGGMRFRSLQRQPGGTDGEEDDALFLGLHGKDGDEVASHPDSDKIRRKTYLVYDESHLPPDTHHSVAPYTYLIGAVRDASQIADAPFRYIVELSCRHGVNVHIVVGEGVEECRSRFDAAARAMYSASQRHRCGRFELLGEPADLHALENRVDRIAYLRDFQREHLRVVLENGQEDDVIVVADLDLHNFPSVSKLMHEVKRMRKYHEYDVLCSNGLMHRPNGYYDLYATVLLPDTFMYPIKYRLLKKSWEGEDISKVRSHDEFGEVTSWDLLDWIESEGERRRREATEARNNRQLQSDGNPLWEKMVSMRELDQFGATSASEGEEDAWYKIYTEYLDEYKFEPSIAVPVRSCFGGLTIYSATALLEPSCRYHPPTVGEEANRLLKYANLDDKRPCEHVVFHDCLYRMHERMGIASRIAIQPDMRTMWNDTPLPRNKLVSDSDQDALITFFKQGDRGDRLTSPNERHSLVINSDGVLVLESCESAVHGVGKDCSHPTVRVISHPSNTVHRSKFAGRTVPNNNLNNDGTRTEAATAKKMTVPRKNWTHMFLILEGDGNLIMLKQVPKYRLVDGGRGCGTAQDESCQLEVWSSNTAQSDGRNGKHVDMTCENDVNEESLQRYELELTDEGFLELRKWNANDGNGSDVHEPYIWRSNGIEV